jgi:AraC-like DNA-binding protein
LTLGRHRVHDGAVRDLADTVILLGVLQGAALAVVLAMRATNRVANRILAALVGAVALMLLLGYLESRWARHGYPHLLGLGGPLPFLFGPLLYLYIVALTRPLARIESRWLVHALPFLAFIIYMSQAFYLKAGEEKLALAREAMAGTAPFSFYFVNVLEIVQAISYLVASWLALRRYGRKMESYFSDLTRIDLRWLSIMVIAHAGVWSIVLVNNSPRMIGIDLQLVRTFSQAVQLGSVMVLFLTGYISLWQPEVAHKARQAEEPARAVEEPAPAPLNKYQRNRLADDEAKELVQKLEALMTTREAFRDSALTLPVLADSLGATPHLLSQVLNVHIGKSFYVFVNSYRADALKVALADRSQRERGVLELAMGVGFNSKSTLNSFFKRHTGLTPTDFRKLALQEIDRGPSPKSANISGG